MNLIKGQMVKVYQDPITCKKLEGVAIVLKTESLIIDNTQIAQVRFQGAGEHPVDRTINLDNC